MEDVLQMQAAFGRYLELKSEVTQTIATYIFIDFYGHLCAKARTIAKEPKSVEGQFKVRSFS